VGADDGCRGGSEEEDVVYARETVLIYGPGRRPWLRRQYAGKLRDFPIHFLMYKFWLLYLSGEKRFLKDESL
jgi:hypothetical protein